MLYTKLLSGAKRCVRYQKMCSRWLLAWNRPLDIVANCALCIYTSIKHCYKEPCCWQRPGELMAAVVTVIASNPKQFGRKIKIVCEFSACLTAVWSSEELSWLELTHVRNVKCWKQQTVEGRKTILRWKLKYFHHFCCGAEEGRALIHSSRRSHGN